MDQAKEFLAQFSGPEAYFAFFVSLIGCSIGLPMNSDLILITASMLATLGVFKLPLLIPIAFFGLLTGDSINFFLARRFGPKILRKAPFRWIISEARVLEAEKFLATRGNKFIFCIRFLPLIRTVLFFTAGSLRIKPKAFYLLNGASTVLYLTILMNLSYAAGENIDFLLSLFKRFQFGLLTVAIAMFSFAILKGLKKRLTPQ